MTEKPTITLPLSKRHGAPSPYESPIISQLEPSQQPKPFPACGDCPASDWYITSAGLNCFCTAYRLISWGKIRTGDEVTERPIMACDARERAITAYNRKLEEEQGRPA